MEASLTRGQEASQDAERQLCALYEQGVPAVYRSLIRLTGGNRHQAEDLTQETFVKALRSLRGQKRPGAITPTVGWLVVIARHLCIDALRQQSRQVELISTLASLASSVPPETPWESCDSGGPLDALSKVPDDQRVALVLHYVDGLSTREVAALLHRSVHAVESLLARGRRTLASHVHAAASKEVES